jgi:hypothetical protein
MFLTHFVGDIHQPLHCSRKTDMGGNMIHVHADWAPKNSLLPDAQRRSSHHHELNLHAVWDDSIIDRVLEDDYEGFRHAMELDLFDLILQKQLEPEWKSVWIACPDGRRKRCVLQWAEESLDDALEHAYRNAEGGNDITDGDVLSDLYYRTRLPIVKERLAVAGVRLALTLEIALDSGKQSKLW